MHADCNCKTQTTLYYGKSYRIGWYVIAFHYRESFQGLVASQAIVILFWPPVLTLSVHYKTIGT